MLSNQVIDNWISSKLNLQDDLSYSDRMKFQDGDNAGIINEKVERFYKHMRLARFHAGMMAFFLAILGLTYVAVGLEIVDLNLSSDFGLGLLLLLGSGAIISLFRVSSLEKMCVSFECAIEIDALLESNENAP